MLRITIELLPRGDESQARIMGQATIANDGTGTVDVGNYDVTLFTWHDPPKTWKTGRVVGFARKTLGPFDLLFRALAATVASRNQIRRRRQAE